MAGNHVNVGRAVFLFFDRQEESSSPGVRPLRRRPAEAVSFFPIRWRDLRRSLGTATERRRPARSEGGRVSEPASFWRSCGIWRLVSGLPRKQGDWAAQKGTGRGSGLVSGQAAVLEAMSRDFCSNKEPGRFRSRPGEGVALLPAKLRDLRGSLGISSERRRAAEGAGLFPAKWRDLARSPETFAEIKASRRTEADPTRESAYFQHSDRTWRAVRGFSRKQGDRAPRKPIGPASRLLSGRTAGLSGKSQAFRGNNDAGPFRRRLAEGVCLFRTKRRHCAPSPGTRPPVPEVLCDADS